MVKSWCRLIKSTFLVSQGTHLQPALQTWSGAEASTIPPPPLFEGLKNKYPGPGQIPPHWLVDPAGPVGIAWKIMEKKNTIPMDSQHGPNETPLYKWPLPEFWTSASLKNRSGSQVSGLSLWMGMIII